MQSSSSAPPSRGSEPVPSGKTGKVAAVFAGFVGLAAGLPSAYMSTATTFIVPLTMEFGWGRTVPSLMYFAATIGLAVSSIWLGRVIERLGAPLTAAISGLSLAGVLGLLAMQSGSAPLAIILCFLAGTLGAGTGSGLWLAVLPMWFNRGLGRALGITTVGQSVGLTMMPTLAAATTVYYGWRAAYGVLAVTAFLLTMIAVLLLRSATAQRASRVGECHPVIATGLTVAQAMQKRSFWVLACTILLVSMGAVGTSIHLFPLYGDRGVPTAMLSLAVLAVGIGTLVGRIGTGFLLDRLRADIVATGVFGLGGVGILWLALIAGPATLLDIIAPSFMIGAALGSESDILAYISRRLYGLAHFATIYNRLLISFYVGAVGGAVLLGVAADRFASSTPTLIALALCCVAAAAVITTVRRELADASSHYA